MKSSPPVGVDGEAGAQTINRVFKTGEKLPKENGAWEVGRQQEGKAAENRDALDRAWEATSGAVWVSTAMPCADGPGWLR